MTKNLILKTLLPILSTLAFTAQSAPIYRDKTLEISTIERKDEPDFIRVVTNENLLRQANGKLDAENAKEWFEAMFISPEGEPAHSTAFKLTQRSNGETIGYIIFDEFIDGYWETSTGILKEFRGAGFGRIVSRTLAKNLKLPLEKAGDHARNWADGTDSYRELGFSDQGHTCAEKS